MIRRLKPYDCVRVVTDRFRHKGIEPGDVGYVIERWEDGGLEIEISNDDGTTRAQFVAREPDLELEPEG